MTAFDDRKTAAEAKFAHDQEFQFKTIARRNKLLGLWAAEQMGISGADAEAYAKQVVIADFEEPGDADVLRKVLGCRWCAIAAPITPSPHGSAIARCWSAAMSTRWSSVAT